MNKCGICELEDINIVTSYVCIGCKYLLCLECASCLKTTECPNCRRTSSLFNGDLQKLSKDTKKTNPTISYYNLMDDYDIPMPMIVNTKYKKTSKSTNITAPVDRSILKPFETNGVYQVYQDLLKFLHIPPYDETNVSGINIVHNILKEIEIIYQYMKSIEMDKNLARRIQMKIVEMTKRKTYTFNTVPSILKSNFSQYLINSFQDDIILQFDHKILELTLIKQDQLSHDIDKTNLQQRKIAIKRIKSIFPTLTSEQIKNRVTILIGK